MDRLNLSDCAYVCARPTTGKSTLLVNCDNVDCLDTDFLTFNVVRSFMTEQAYAQFKDRHNRTGSLPNLLKLGIIEPIYRFFMQFEMPFVWISNLLPDPDIVDMMNQKAETVFVTRNADVAWDLMQSRAKMLGKQVKITKPDVVRWFKTPDWVMDHFTHVVELDEDEYLCDLFGVRASVTDAEEVDNDFHVQQMDAYFIPSVRTKFRFGVESVPVRKEVRHE